MSDTSEADDAADGTEPVTATDEDEPTVPIRCSACETTTRVPLSSLADAIDRHNRTRHDGEEIAEVAPGIADRLADLVARDLGLLEEE
ncbi:hypothetical protein SAMN05192561_10125 [Halopenitus malekzadehii]|uniref:DUF8149 domain-containing protein n=1 Tax=Halopenitus malekzadehii TaxID=1267564 RepID=A0A1H6HQU5_9EURY|nr:hypothetical protein [Halopenitus malekzadehii]SEH36558.1 hypothetical protein SAMN05192561_10125 [Halopenitus malekzadehii]